MTVRFLKVAQVELREAVRYYESQAVGLGADLLLEVTAAVDRITEFPVAWQTVDAELRRCQLGRFPYALVYAEDGDGFMPRTVMASSLLLSRTFIAALRIGSAGFGRRSD